ncbi:hypothetical protein TWF481_009442 [Arthrobotrys musiformis]|uniref:Uncharacterized protein n=1 Tax=Arthrobotrys musiformis TaxID=47236 RepID=A0AAV9W3M6_9PEZI
MGSLIFRVTFLLLFCFGLVRTTFVPPPHDQKLFQPNDPAKATSRYFKYEVRVNGNLIDSENPIPSLYVGEKSQISVRVMVRDSNGVTLCDKDLAPTGSLTANPPDIIFYSTSYSVESGALEYVTGHLHNPFLFSGWYPGPATLIVEGTACLEYTKEKHIIYQNVDFIGATVLAGDESGCKGRPEINNNFLSWGSTKGGNGWSIFWGIENSFPWPVRFGGVQYIIQYEFYLILEGGRKYLLESTTPESPVLDAIFHKPKLVRHSVGIRPGDSVVLDFGDSPGIELENGRWSSRSGDKGTYTSVGFNITFRAFVLQDWDLKLVLRKAWQTPIGGPGTIFEWVNGAQADLHIVNGVSTWKINNGKTAYSFERLPGGVTSNPPVWIEGAHQNKRNNGDYNPKTGRYELYT